MVSGLECRFSQSSSLSSSLWTSACLRWLRWYSTLHTNVTGSDAAIAYDHRTLSSHQRRRHHRQTRQDSHRNQFNRRQRVRQAPDQPQPTSCTCNHVIPMSSHMNKHQETVRLVQAHLAVYITDLMRPRSSDWSTTRPLSGGGGYWGAEGV